MQLSYIIIPLISAFIGYFTNWIAVKMLFHPRNPIQFLGFTIQGIFPKRQAQFAEKLGKMVSNELLSFEEIEQKLTSPSNLERLKPHIEKQVDHFLRERLPEIFPVISMFIGEKTLSSLKETFLSELGDMFPSLMQQYAGSLKQELDLEKIVVDKVSNFSSDKLEDLLYQIMSKEFRFVEILGGVLGFLIGIIQVMLTSFLS